IFLDNGLVRVEVDSTDGTFRLSTPDGLSVGGLNRYVDGGDGGDTYNWSPPGNDHLVEVPDRVAVDVTDDGPLRARAVIAATYRWPTHAEGDERACHQRAETSAEVAVRATAAGPPVAVEGPQPRGRLRRRYGVLRPPGGWREAALHGRADDFLLPCEAVAIRNASVAPTRPAVGSALCLSGAEVSAVLRD